MKYRGVVQEKVNANSNALEQMKERLEQGVLDPQRALNWLEQCINRNESVQEYLDAEEDEFGYDARNQRAQQQSHKNATR